MEVQNVSAYGFYDRTEHVEFGYKCLPSYDGRQSRYRSTKLRYINAPTVVNSAEPGRLTLRPQRTPPTSPNNMAWCFMCPNDIGLRFGSEGQAAAARVQKLPKAFIEYMTVDSNFLSPAKILKELQNERVSLRSLTDGSLTGTNGTSLVAPSCPMSRK